MRKTILCLWLCLLVSIATNDMLGSRCQTTRQGDALGELYFDAFKMKKAASSIASYATNLFSNPSLKNDLEEGLKEKDKITKLPGQPQEVNFEQYGGYVTVDSKNERALFYYFATASIDPSSKPLVLWLHGGPGCSALLGAMEEIGPFRVMSDGKTLFSNPYAWNKVANVLFLESPAGVGFSYSNTTSDYDNSGDNKTAEDAYVFLVNWLERFPEYKQRDFFLTGESYAGHFVPQLAHSIFQHNNTDINLKGIMIGNGVYNDETDNKGVFNYWWTHALISKKTIHDIHKYCNFSPNAADQTVQCINAVKLTTNLFETIDILNVYAPLCSSAQLTNSPKKYSIKNYDPCSNIYLKAYLNTLEVQEALHANVTNLKYPWYRCSQLLQWVESPSTVLPLIKECMAKDVRVWIYSGDIDGRVPVTSTIYSLDQLNLPIQTSWHPWFTKNEVAGYSVIYQGNLTFTTIRGAGHSVPSYRGLQALVLAKSFLNGELLPSK